MTSLWLTFVLITAGQNDNFSFRTFPKEELVPLSTAYGLALDNYAAANWTDSVKYLELSLRLFRLLKDSVRYCTLHCDQPKHDGPSFTGNRESRVYWRIMMRALCQKKCREHFPVLQLPPPGRDILDDFNRRSPYKYLHFAYSRVRHAAHSEKWISSTVSPTTKERNPWDMLYRSGFFLTLMRQNN